MPYIFILLLLALVFYIFKNKEIDKISKVIILMFLVYWTTSFIVSTFNPYNMYPVSDRAYIYLFINVLSITAGFLSVKISKKTQFNSQKLNDQVKKLMSSLWFRLLVVLNLSIIIHLLINESQLLIMSDMAEIREDMYEMIFTNKYEAIYYTLIMPVVNNIIVFVLAYSFFFVKGDIFKKIIYLISVMCYSLIGGSRTLAFYPAIYLVFFYLARKEFSSVSEENTKGIRIRLILVASVIFVIMVLSTNFRVGNADSSLSTGSDVLGGHFVSYSVGPFRAFDYAINKNYLSHTNGFTILGSTFQGLILLLNYFFRFIGFEIPTFYEQTIGYQQTNYIFIGSDMSFNFAYTNAMIFYYDLGVLGIVIYGFIFGFAFRKIVGCLYKESSLYSAIMVGLFLFVLLYTVFNWLLVKAWTWILILSYVFIKTTKKPRLTY